MVVAGQQQHAAMLRTAREIAVPQHVAGPVDAGPLGVPHRENAVIVGVREQVELLAAPDCRGGEVFVDAGFEMDVVLLDERLRLPELLVEGTERRASVAGDETARIEAGGGVALPLHQGQSDERLNAGQEYPTRFQGVIYRPAIPGARPLSISQVVTAD